MLSKPTLALDMVEITKAYQVLHASRINSGFGMSPITVADITGYVSLVGEAWCGNMEFITQIKRLDEFHIKEIEDNG